MLFRMPHLSFAFLLFDRVTQLDLTGPVQVLSRAGDCTVQLVAKSAAPVMTDAGFAIVPTHTLEQVTDADVLCIPGGAGADDAMMDAEIVAWVQQVASKAAWVTSVCTGSLILGAAGLLQGKRATSHWTARELLTEFGALPSADRYVIDGNVITGGGVTAGIDFALALLALLRGEEHAKRVQLALPCPAFQLRLAGDC
jgi:cyclohexyl-isocyanide hydratase